MESPGAAHERRAPLNGTSVDFPPRGIVPSVGWKSQFPKNNSVDHGPGSNTYESSNQPAARGKPGVNEMKLLRAQKRTNSCNGAAARPCARRERDVGKRGGGGGGGGARR